MKALYKYLFPCLLFVSFLSKAQTDSTSKTKRNRILFHTATGFAYVGTFAALNQAWYSQYERSSFHWFDDSGEWMQVDKLGHAQTAYLITADILYPSYRALGYSEKQAIWMAMGVSWTFQATIEVLDGFSAKWGASWSDLAANTFGVALAGTQQLLWHEQRILFKYSSSLVDYGNDPIVNERVDNLYGTSTLERLFKDYNGTTFWLSTNVSAFLNPKSKFPKWLNIAAGYGAQNMLGGYYNQWNDEQGNYHDYNNLERYRQFYIAPDVDFTRIPIKGKAWKFIAPVLNIFKMPAPTLEFNKNGVKGHWLFF